MEKVENTDTLHGLPSVDRWRLAPIERMRESREVRDTREADYFDNLARREEKRAKESQKFDDAYANYAKNVSVGKAVAGNLLLGPFRYKTYSMARAVGYERGKAAAAAFLDLAIGVLPVLPQGVSVQRHRIRENYIDGLR